MMIRFFLRRLRAFPFPGGDFTMIDSNIVHSPVNHFASLGFLDIFPTLHGMFLNASHWAPRPAAAHLRIHRYHI
jgi:hypothetical protein